MLNGRERDELNPLIEELKQNLPKYGNEIMTYAEELRQEGKQEGRQEAQLEIAKGLLKRGVDSETVAIATHLSNAQLNELKKSLK